MPADDANVVVPEVEVQRPRLVFPEMIGGIALSSVDGVQEEFDVSSSVFPFFLKFTLLRQTERRFVTVSTGRRRRGWGRTNSNRHASVGFECASKTRFDIR